MGIAVLGPLEVDGQSRGLSPRDRVVLSALVVREGEPSSTEALADVLWGDSPPASWAKVVHGCVARLRKLLGTAAIESGASGYRLTITATEVDSARFERLFQHAREALAGGDSDRASYLVTEALDLWRGRALTDLEEWPPGRVEAARLEGLRMDAEELRVEAEIQAGRARDGLERARALVAEAPFRERRWALLAVTLHQSGRQAEALAALKQARAMLVEQLGLDPGPELAELETQLLRQDPALDPVVSQEVSASCPYRGLLPYEAADADSFFGREAAVAACLRKLRDARVLAVVGPSGIGKSSLVRAGVVTSLIRSGTPVLVTTPGSKPAEALSGLRPRQTLVVDQAEEALTAYSNDEERAGFFASLAAHVAAGGSLVLSMRADHLGDLAPYPDVARLLEEGLYLLGPMTGPDLRSAIEGPARRAGLRLEAGLVDLLVRDVEGEPAALPLLSHVLRELWERREGRTLTVSGYQATGGIRSAVAQSAEKLYDAMDDAQRARLRTLLLRLVMPTEDGHPVRARVPRAKVAASDEQQWLVEELVSARLVSIDGESVQIAHEALVRVWPRLRGWLDDDVEGQRLFRHLAGAADAWDAMGRPESELYRGARLARATEWRERADPDLNESESAFLDASVALEARESRKAEARLAEQRRVNRRLRGSLVGVGLLLVLAMVVGLLAVRSADRASRQRDLAAVEQDRAESAAALASIRRTGALAVRHEDLATGLLLAVESVHADDEPQAMENLGALLTRAGARVGVRDVGGMLGRSGFAWMPSVSASAEGGVLAANVLHDRARLFDVTTLEPLALPALPNARSLALAPDGNLLAVATDDVGSRALRLYDLPSGVLADSQPGGLGKHSSLNNDGRYDADPAFSRDGSRLVAELQSERLSGNFLARGLTMVWDVAHPASPVFRVRLPAFAMSALSPDGDRLYVATRGAQSLRVYDVASGDLVASAADPLLAQRGATAVDLSPDGSTFAVGARDRVQRFDADTLAPAGPPLRHSERVHDVVFSHDGRLLATASIDGSSLVWDARTGALLHRQAAGGLSVTFSADDRTLYTTGAAGLLEGWRVPGTSRQLVLGEDGDTAGNDYELSLPAPDGRTLARVRAGRLALVDSVTGRTTGRSGGEPLPFGDDGFVWSPDSLWLLSYPVFGGSATVWDATTGSIVARRRLSEDSVVGFGQNPTVVHAYENFRLHTLTPASLQPVNAPVSVAGARPVAVVAHPHDRSVFVVDEDGSFVRVDPVSGDVKGSSPAGRLNSEGSAWVLSPDGTRMVVNAAQSVRLLDVEKQEYVGADSQSPWGRSLAYAPDGSQFAVVQQDRIQLWDGSTGDYQGGLPLPSSSRTVSVAYRPDSSGLVIASTDGRTWTADTRTNTWVDRACAIAGRNLTGDEWRQFFPYRPYERTCSQWPAG